MIFLSNHHAPRGHSSDPQPRGLTSAFGHAARACEAAPTTLLPSTQSSHSNHIPAPRRTKWMQFLWGAWSKLWSRARPIRRVAFLIGQTP